MRKWLIAMCVVGLMSPVYASVPANKNSVSTWNDLLTVVLRQGTTYKVPNQENLVAVSLESASFPTIDRIVLLGLPDPKSPDTLYLMQVGLSVEVWSKSGAEMNTWSIDRWIFSTTAEGKITAVDHQSISINPEGKIVAEKNLLSHSSEEILPEEKAIFDRALDGWFLRVAKP